MRNTTKKLIATLLCLVSCITLLTGCKASKDVPLTLKIDDATFDFKSTVQDFYDAGFVICDTAYGKITSDSDLPDFEAREVDTISHYYVGRPISSTMAEFTGVIIQVFNPSNKSCSFKETSIFNYIYQHDVNFEPTVTVLFNDVDFSNMTHEEGLLAMENMGITFEEDEKAEFLDETTNRGYGWSAGTSSFNYNYFISRDVGLDGTLYVDEVYFKRALDIDYN